MTERDETDHWEVASRVQFWVWAAIAQLDEYERAFFDGQTMRVARDVDSDEYARLNARRGAALHFLLIAVRHVVKASQFLPDGPALEQRISKPVRLLRDLLEHWDKEEARFDLVPPHGVPGASGQEFQKRFPDAHPWTMEWNPEVGVVIGGVLSFDDLRQALAALETDLPSVRPPSVRRPR